MTILETCSKTFQFIKVPYPQWPQINVHHYLDMTTGYLKSLSRRCHLHEHVQALHERTTGLFQEIMAKQRRLKSRVITFYDQMIVAVKHIASKIQNLWDKVVHFWQQHAGYVIGPSISLSVGALARLSLGKRTPTQGPLYVSLFLAASALITIWAVKFFRHPQTKKIIQTQGVTTALAQALPLPKAKVIEPMHSRHFMSFERYENLMSSFEAFKPELTTDAAAKTSLANLKMYCEWVLKKIRLTRANPETLAVLKKTLTQNLIKVFKAVILTADKKLVEDFIKFLNQDPFVMQAMTKDEIEQFISAYGYRLALVTKQSELLELFKMPKSPDLSLYVLDAIMTSNGDKIIEYTNMGVVDSQKIYAYAGPDDEILSGFTIKPVSTNLLQASILLGDVDIVKRIVASSTQEIDWKQRNAQGLSLQSLSALSGSKAMWDFVLQFTKQLPELEHQDYLFMLYAVIKSNNRALFEELFEPFTHVDKKGTINTLALDLYQKAVASSAKNIQSYLETTDEIKEEIISQKNTTALLKAALKGSHRELFNLFYDAWKLIAQDNSLLIQEMYEQAFSASKPHEEIIQDLIDFEATFAPSTMKLDVNLSAQTLITAMMHLKEDLLVFLLQRLSPSLIVRYIGEQGPFFYKLLKMPRLLEIVLDKCSEAKYLALACAQEAVKTGQLETLRMLCSKGVDSLKPLPGSKETLLSYAMLSFNPDLVEIILSKSAPLSALLIGELKSRITDLKCHKSDDAACAAILRMLDAKSFERGVHTPDDPQLHLALVKAGAMEFVFEPETESKEDVSRGLLASSLGYLGLI